MVPPEVVDMRWIVCSPAPWHRRNVLSDTESTRTVPLGLRSTRESVLYRRVEVKPFPPETHVGVNMLYVTACDKTEFQTAR